MSLSPAGFKPAAYAFPPRSDLVQPTRIERARPLKGHSHLKRARLPSSATVAFGPLGRTRTSNKRRFLRPRAMPIRLRVDLPRIMPRLLTMTIRTQECEVFGAIVEPVVIAMVDFQDDWPAVPSILQSALFTTELSPRLN